MRQTLLSQLYRFKKTESERLTNLLKITQITVESRFQPGLSLAPDPAFLHSICP